MGYQKKYYIKNNSKDNTGIVYFEDTITVADVIKAIINDNNVSTNKNPDCEELIEEIALF
jgi:hypothetical protein